MKIKKQGSSTFFPDDWNKEKIKNEIGEVYGNIKKKEANKPYNAKVFAKDSNGNEIQKNGFSTFFPDNWDRKKIMEEVEYAVKNNSGKNFPGSTGNNANVYKGMSKDGKIEINFAYKDGILFTFYPFIK